MLNMVLMQRKGYVSDQCDDGSTALKRIEEVGLNHYDIIFMDSMMPNIVSFSMF